MIQTMLEYSFIVFLIILYKKVPVFLSSIEISHILSVVFEIYLYSMSMLYAINKLSIVYLLIKVVDNPLILCVLNSVLSKVNTVFILFDQRLIDANRKAVIHLFKVGRVLVEAHVFTQLLGKVPKFYHFYVIYLLYFYFLL
jgi:hypothetical protein